MNPLHIRTRGWLVLAGLTFVAALTWVSGRRATTPARATEPIVAHATASAAAPAASRTATAARTERPAQPAESRRARVADRAGASARPPAPASVGARVVALDPETGQLGAPSPEQIRALRNAAGSAAVSRSDEGLMQTRLSNGTVILVLDGRFEDYALARIGRNGRLLYGCVHDEGGPRKALRDTVSVRALEEE